MKSVHHFWLIFSAVKFCFSLFSNTLWGFPGFVPGADDGAQAQLPVHIFMDSCAAVAVSPAFQISCHAVVTVHTVMAVADIPDLLLNCCFLGIIIRLPVFPVVIISIRADSQPLQQPADSEFFMVLFNEPISL